MNKVYKVSIMPYWMIISCRNSPNRVFEQYTKDYYNYKFPQVLVSYWSVFSALRNLFL